MTDRFIQSVETLTGGTADRFVVSAGPGLPVQLLDGPTAKTALGVTDGADGADGADGSPGANGADGDDGLSAYQVAVLEGFVGDVTAWLASLVGATGATGATGSQGPQGDAGATGAADADGADGQGVPTGGTSGQLLAKSSGTDFDTAWINQSAIVLTERQIVYLSSTKADAEAALSVIDFDVPEAWSLIAVKFECDKDNPPTGASAQMDIRKNGTSIFSTNPTIDATESSSDTAATAPVLASNPTTISAGDNLDFDLDQIGASDAGRGYYAVLIYTRSNS